MYIMRLTKCVSTNASVNVDHYHQYNGKKENDRESCLAKIIDEYTELRNTKQILLTIMCLFILSFLFVHKLNL